MMKFCKNKGCKQINPQPLLNFALKKRYKDGIYSQCNDCVNEKSRIYTAKYPEKRSAVYKKNYWADPDKHRHKARLYRFKDKYWPELSITQIDALWNQMFETQKGLCSICEKPKRLDVEHCHKTGKVRSLACNGCNTALARINEDATIAKALISYIEKHNV